MLARAKSVLVGRNPRTSLWFLSVAAVLFAVTFRLLSAPLASVDPHLAHPRLVTGLVGIAAVVAAAANASRNEGILVSLVVGSAPPLALWLFVGQRAGLLVPEAVPWILGFALAYGLPMGLVGFALGTELARRRGPGGPTPTTNGGPSADPVVEASEGEARGEGRPVVGRLVVWSLVVLGVAAGAGAVGYCAVPGVSCTLGTFV